MEEEKGKGREVCGYVERGKKRGGREGERRQGGRKEDEANVYSVVSAVTSSASPVPLTLFLCPPPRSQSVSVAPVSLNFLANDAIPSFVVYDCIF